MGVHKGLLSLLLLAASLGAMSQDIRISMKNAPLQKIFAAIKKQSGYAFLYTDQQLKGTANIDIDIKNATLQQALDICFRNQPVTYSIVNKTVIVQMKQEPVKRDSLIQIKGRVLDENNQPVEGASVMVAGANRGATTNAEGFFELNDVAASGELVVTGANIDAKQVAIGGNANVVVHTNLKIHAEEEVVVNAGYYNVKKREATGNISRIDSKTIEKQPVSNPLQAMQGRMPGVYINQFSGLPGTNFQVNIRGTNSIEGGNDPLYIIDGVPFVSESMSFSQTSQVYGQQLVRGRGKSLGTSPLNNINPADIESIEVLKDADATAIYGSRGANGVVLITTKKGKEGKLKIEANIMSGISKMTRRVDLLNTEEYLRMRMLAVHNDGDSTPGATEYDINGVWDQSRYTDWQDVLLGGTAGMADANASIAAGNQQTNFLFSAGYNSQGVVFPGNNSARRFTTHFSVGHTTPDKRFNTHLSTSYTTTNTDLLSRDLTNTALSIAPDAPAIYTSDGKINWENSTWENPLALLLNRFNGKTYNLLMSLSAGYSILENLAFKFNVGLNDIRNSESETGVSSATRPAIHFTPSNYSYLNTGQRTSRSLIAEPQINWDKKFNNNSLSVVLGGTWQYNESELNQINFRGFPTDDLVNDPNSASTITNFFNNYTQYRYLAAYGRVNYNWNHKYILNITGRRDGSSRFGPGKKFSNFGAAGGAWVFSNEPFIAKKFQWLSFGKLRASYGTTGNDQIGDYQYLDTYGAGPQYQGVSTLGPSQLLNPDFRWEINNKMEYSVDVGLFSDRLNMSASFYRNRSSNQLVNYKLAGTTGYATILRNFPATVENSGWEFLINTVNLNAKNFRWTTSANITFPRNKLIAFPGLESSSYATFYTVGKSLNLVKSFRFMGINAENGIYRVEDFNYDGEFTLEDRTSVFEIGQTFYGGLSNSISYKSFEVDIFIQFVKQTGELFTTGATGGKFDAISGTGNIPSKIFGDNIFDNRYQNEGSEARWQAFSRSEMSSYGSYLFSASDAIWGSMYFVRLKNVSISYAVPRQWVRGITSKVFLQGQNLLTRTDYTGLDPETGSSKLPPLMTLVAGINISL